MNLDRLDRTALAVTERVAALGVIGIIAVAVFTVADVLLRVGFNSPIRGLNEITQPLMALGVAACLPAGVMGRVNISIDAAQSVMPKTVYAWLRVLGAVALLVFLVLVSWRLFAIAARAYDLGSATSVLRLPLGPILMSATVIVGLSVPFQLIPVARSLWDAFEVNRRAAIAICAVLAVLAGAVAFNWPGAVALAQPLLDLPPTYLALVCFGLIWIGVLLTIPIAAATGLAGLLGSVLLLGPGPGLSMFGNKIQEMLFNDSLAVLPLFLLMGSFATVAGMSGEIYRCAQAMIGHLRGGLAIATVLGSAGFGALTGSSLATSATIGKVALPEMAARNYSRSLAAGSVAAGGTLGQLVPPSTIIVLYALLTEESIGTLFIASIGPAVLTVLLYIAAIFISVSLKPSWAPAGTRPSLRDMAASFLGAWKAILLIGAVIGGIYTGVFTEVEAASVGVIGAFIIGLLKGAIRRETIWTIMRETTTTVAMVYMLIFGAASFSFLMGISGLPDLLVTAMTSITQEPMLIIVMIVMIYLVLGTVMDSIAIMIIAVPVLMPLITQMGLDPIWWAILTICIVEIGLITPPFGLNLFIMKSIDPELSLSDVYRGVAPFILADLIKIVLLIAFPIIVLWLPGTR
ncbi:TRAP transporter large permease subunit [Frigidibacter sp.]|uniref:TRAP transporter large permease n=1 Tax=Frigidibacter sp. TaxID=2586418 RepID=UPI0027332C4F|nr:TRAP transporter large permease subunit [Frigidibacter sp.]MDP3342193.1 TRAP transporter large permease subunit [Frigidibacter sp.]